MKRVSGRRLTASIAVSAWFIFISLGSDSRVYAFNVTASPAPLLPKSGVLGSPHRQMDKIECVPAGVGLCRQIPDRTGNSRPIVADSLSDDNRVLLTEKRSHDEIGPSTAMSELMIAQSPYRKFDAPEQKLPPLSCSEQFESMLSGQVLRFELNSSAINPNGLRKLDRLVQFIDACPESHIEIAGHTDSIGGEKLNKNLSLRRAMAVVDYLISKGVKKGKLKSVGFGELKPIADNETLKGQARNRRVEFKYLQEGN